MTLKHLTASKLLVLAFAVLVMLTPACQKDTDKGSSVQNNQTLKYTTTSSLIPGQYIVVFKSNVVAQFNKRTMSYNAAIANVTEASNTILNENGIILAQPLLASYAASIQGFAAKLDDASVAKLKADPRVAIVEQDRLISLGKPSGGGGSTQPAQITPWGITRVGGPSSATDKTAWIIDTGLDPTHPELNVDQARSRNFLQPGAAGFKSMWDGNGHGTFCAGIISAKNDAYGVVGIVAGNLTVSVRVLDNNGSGSYSGVINGVDYVASAASAGDVANLSLGGPPSSALDAAVLNLASKGVYVTLAAGNETKDVTTTSPARTNGTNVYSVSAMDKYDVFAYFSNFGTGVDYCDPGVEITSTYLGGGYATGSGTSFAAPHLAGILLQTSGSPTTSGYVTSDPDGNADPIGHE